MHNFSISAKKDLDDLNNDLSEVWVLNQRTPGVAVGRPQLSVLYRLHSTLVYASFRTISLQARGTYLTFA